VIDTRKEKELRDAEMRKKVDAYNKQRKWDALSLADLYAIRYYNEGASDLEIRLYRRACEEIDKREKELAK